MQAVKCGAVQQAVHGFFPDLMDTRRVDIDRLHAAFRLDTENTMACGLGLFRGNGDLLPEDTIQQGRFTDIGSSYNRYITAATGYGLVSHESFSATPASLIPASALLAASCSARRRLGPLPLKEVSSPSTVH